MKAYNIGDNRETNGNWCASYYFLYGELNLIEIALEQLYDQEKYWMTDDRVSVSDDAKELCDSISQLIMKLEHYKSCALRNREEE